MRFNSRFWYLLSILFFVAAGWVLFKGGEEKGKGNDPRSSAGQRGARKLPGAIAPCAGQRILRLVARGGGGVCVLHSEQRGIGACVSGGGESTGRFVGDPGGVGV